MAIAFMLVLSGNLLADTDTSPLPFKTEVAFADLHWTGWEPVDDQGQPAPLRPILLTHPNDGSGRIIVPTQQGVIHTFTTDAKKTDILMDMTAKVVYADKTNEEGLLGLAFHPNFKANGEFFVYYTTTEAKQLSVISRFRVGKDGKANVDSEEEILRIKQPFWNHNGGTIAFGLDGYLYIGLGDGGAANDPFGNGQNTKTLLGSILRIDVDHKDPGKAYAIPKDNPFAGKKDGSKPEIYAYGLRNVWRIAFDRKTGVCWAGDVGQDIWEEIDIIVKGGNYGWNRREGMHPFGPKGSEASSEFIEPIWEYHHDIGKSITGGVVYRGKQFPELEGAYLYADYVSGKIWALWYDFESKKVTANREIEGQKLPIMSFGEDQEGEVYLTTYSPTGQGLLKLARK